MNIEESEEFVDKYLESLQEEVKELREFKASRQGEKMGILSIFIAGIILGFLLGFLPSLLKN